MTRIGESAMARHTFEPKHDYTLGLNKLGKILEQVRFENWVGDR